MVQRVAESLTAGVEVRLLAIEENGERILFEGHGRHAGLELGGQIERLARA
jgi:hypothetical protein